MKDGDGLVMLRNSNIAKIYAIGSGKGGVGKSTITLNIAISLINKGYSVGIFDSDIYSNSIPTMLGIKHAHKNDKDTYTKNNFTPPTKFGIKILSPAFFTLEHLVTTWRGRVLYDTLKKMLFDTIWGNCDILLIDLPPGIGEIPLILSQLLPIDGAIIVIDSQETTLVSARKISCFFDSVDIPIVGVIENMARLKDHQGNDVIASDILRKCFGDTFWDSIPVISNIYQNNYQGTRNNAMKYHFDYIAEQLLHKAMHQQYTMH